MKVPGTDGSNIAAASLTNSMQSFSPIQPTFSINLPQVWQCVSQFPSDVHCLVQEKTTNSISKQFRFKPC